MTTSTPWAEDRARFLFEDSYSDGMCGWVEITDLVTSATARVHWNVFSDQARSQSDAIDRAIDKLKGGAA